MKIFNVIKAAVLTVFTLGLLGIGLIAGLLVLIF